MNTKILILSLFFCLFIFNHCSTEKGKLTQIQNGVQLEKADLKIRIQFYSDDMVRIVKWPIKGKPDKKSLVVLIDSIPNLKILVKEEGNNVILSSSKLKLILSQNTGNVKFMTISDSLLLQENGTKFKDIVYKDDTALNVQQNFSLTKDEGIYGLGQNQNGYFNYRGKTVNLAQSNTEAITPFLISTNGYGIYWDNYSYSVFSDSTSGTSLWSDVGDNIDYYFIRGNNMDNVIAGYRSLTGQAPMYGKYAYGYWQSKEHYQTQAELMKVATEYRKRQIPIDNMIQDWDYWNGSENWGGMFFDKTLFPTPDEMVAQLHKMNLHMMISIWPALGPNTAIYKDMNSRGFLYKPVGWAGFKYYDAYNQEANQLYWQYLKSGLFSKGIDGWWIDSTEPDVINALTKESSNYELKKMGKNHLGTFARYLNTFSLVMTDALYKNLRKETDKRVYILTRSTFAGQQRNGATTWSGDIGANWSVYRNQISAGLNHCLSGIPYWTFDIGAFVIGAYEGVFNEGGKDPAYQELYTRMFQLGAFTPIFRSHGSETPREIWEMGEFQNVLIKYDNLRYRLMPYLYSLAWKVTDQGYTIMRGLPMDFASDKNTYSIDDQFMFGPAIMACPVTEYMYYCPPQASEKIGAGYFKTNDGKNGLKAYYYKDNKYGKVSKEQIDSNIDIFWYTGRPDYVTDSMYSIRWEGKLIPKESGKYQFHIKSFDGRHIKVNGKVLNPVYKSTEEYSEIIDLKAGQEYDIEVSTENNSTGASRFQLFWKTPSIFAKETSKEIKEKSRNVYLPESAGWIDFWTGKAIKGGQKIKTNAPIDIMPLFVRAGSIIPMGPFLQYTTEKPGDPIELRIYPGAKGSFVLYEDENEFHNYEKGVYSTIQFSWDDATKKLTIKDQKGSFPGILKQRTFNIVIVREGHGTGVELCTAYDKSVSYNGKQLEVQF